MGAAPVLRRSIDIHDTCGACASGNTWPGNLVAGTPAFGPLARPPLSGHDRFMPSGRVARQAALHRQEIAMWYFTWILGIGVALGFGIINVMWLEANGTFARGSGSASADASSTDTRL